MKNFITRRKIPLCIGLMVILIALVAWNVRGSGADETVVVGRGELVKTVELSGKVVPKDEVDLAFEVGGTVLRVNKKVGDPVAAGEILAELDKAKVSADLAKAEADLAVARAELARLEGGVGTEAKLTSSMTSLVQDILDAYTTADDAIHNKVDQYFDDGTSAGPEILNSFNDNQNIERKINNTRLLVEEMLTAWKKEIAGLTVATYSEKHLEKAKNNLEFISAFLADVSIAVNSFETNPGLTQTTIDKYRTDTATARTNINAAKASLISAGTSFSDTISDVSVEAARVRGALATVQNYRATLSKMTLRSPIGGVVSKQEAKVGEAVSANAVIASVISPHIKIDAYLPEVSFAGIDIGNKAAITFDSYGDEVSFEGRITHIDPRETIRDGVSTYKIELELSRPDARVRSGMTANIHIETARKASVLIVPLRSIVEKNGAKTVSIQNEEGETIEVTITTGMTDSSGNAEVLSGLSEGDTVLLNP